MGLGALDVDVDCCSEGSGEILDAHELGELLDTVGSDQQRHEQVGAAADNRMQAGGDDADEGQPTDVAAVRGSADTTHGGDAHVGVRSHAQGHTGQDAAQDSGEAQGAAEDSSDVFWGWVAQESTEGWLQLSGGGPQRGKGKPLMEWRVRAAEAGAGGWGGMLANVDTPWFATFRMKVRQQMLQLTEEAVSQVTQAMLQRVWMTSAKSQTKQVNARKQCRKIYDTTLAQLHQQREIALVGSAAKLMTRKQLAAAMRATVACGALPMVLRAESVVDVTRACGGGEGCGDRHNNNNNKVSGW